MNDITKVGASHLGRAAYIYLRQSTPSQVEHNRESTQRQYALAARATTLGWPSQQVVVVDEDLGLSGSGIVERNGFARLTAEVALGHVGIVLGLEVSRLARNNADWYRLLDLCGLTDTLIGDADGIYHPAMFNDRLLLGLKGTMSEAELHIIRARLNGGIRNKAARGELRRGLPVGLIWGEEDGEVRFHPDEAVCSAIRTVFARFAELGSVRRLTTYCVRLELRSRPSPGITRLPRYNGPLRLPRAPSLSLTGVRLIIPDHALGLPVLRALSLCTCCHHYPGAVDGRTRRSNLAIHINLPRNHYRVGLHIDLFEACSAFTRVAACTLAQSPNS